MYFTSIPEKYLVQIFKSDNLQLKEVEIWEHLLKWGLAQNPEILSDPRTWSDEDIKKMENTLQQLLPLIRFFSFSSKEFSQKVRPYKRLLKRQFYEDLANSYLDPDSEPNENVSFPRNVKSDEILDSQIINLNIVSTVLRWVDKVDINNKFSRFRELYLPYKFELLLRGSRDGFTPHKFHELCDDKPDTVTFIKIKGTDEIIGGYNSGIWLSLDKGDWGKAKHNFIFSFNSTINSAIISNVRNHNYAIWNQSYYGPYFGYYDIAIFAINEHKNYNMMFCRQTYYEKNIRDSNNRFSIEDYEVFQIVK
jgi:hypothetical protein